jgi:hypothetical protein
MAHKFADSLPVAARLDRIEKIDEYTKKRFRILYDTLKTIADRLTELTTECAALQGPIGPNGPIGRLRGQALLDFEAKQNEIDNLKNIAEAIVPAYKRWFFCMQKWDADRQHAFALMSLRHSNDTLHDLEILLQNNFHTV